MTQFNYRAVSERLVQQNEPPRDSMTVPEYAKASAIEAVAWALHSLAEEQVYDGY